MYASLGLCCSFFLSDIMGYAAYTGLKLTEKATGCKDDDGLVTAFTLMPVFFYGEVMQEIFAKFAAYGFTASSLFTLYRMINRRQF